MKLYSKCKALFAILCLMVTFAPTEAWADNPALVDGYYELSTVEDLKWFASQVNGGNYSINGRLTADITFNSNVLKTDGTLNEGEFDEWTPIGSYSLAYSGKFDGAGHSISGLYYNSNEAEYIGLFGYVEDATLTGINIKDSYFAGDDFVGGIAGSVYNTTVSLCSNAASIITYSDDAGGICGAASNSSISNCYNLGFVIDKTDDGCGAYLGGIVGYVYDNSSIQSCLNLTGVQDCEFSGHISCQYSTCSKQNCYYLSATAVSLESKTQSQFESGLVCYLLNGESSEGVWRQSAGAAYPSFVGDYTAFAPCSEHQFEGGFCSVCGMAYELQKEDGYYLIATADDLKWFANQVNLGNNSINGRLTADITLNSDVLKSDGTLNEGEFDEWTPIGYKNSFQGKFDGQGFSVSGIYCNKDYQLDDYDNYGVGFFGEISAASIKGVNIKDSYIRGKYAGAICAYAYDESNITMCANIGSTVEGAYVGGLCEYLAWSSSIKNCYNTGKINYEEYGAGICAEIKSSYLSNSFTLSGPVYYEYNEASSVSNCYYVSRENNMKGGLTMEHFKSGLACYLLNNKHSDTEDERVVWRQNVGTDDYPTFEGPTVLASNVTCPHIYGEDLVCGICGAEKTPDTDEDGNYLIKTVEDLYLFARMVNNGNNTVNAILMNDITVNEDVFNADGYLNTGKTFNEWTPIGYDYWHPFFGSFDGNNHTISGLYITEKNSNYDQPKYGFIGNADVNSSVKNLKIADSYYYVTDGCAGGICGYASPCNISNCSFSGKIESTTSKVGGICGYVVSASTIKECSVSAKIIGDGEVGGIIGSCKERCDVSDCSFNGSIDASGEYVAGISGKHKGNIHNCSVEGNVSAGSGTVGGICNLAAYNCTIDDCTVTALVTSNGNCVGGICGLVSGSVFDANAVFDRCIVNGTVDAEGDYVGGIVGKYYHSDYADRSLWILNCHNRATVVGNSCIAGIIGYAFDSLKVSNCINTGWIIARGSYAGGIVGYSYTRGMDIGMSRNFSAVSASTYASGICGYENASAQRIYHCYNTGAITADNGIATGIYYGVHSTAPAVKYNVAYALYCHNYGQVNASSTAYPICNGSTSDAYIKATNCFDIVTNSKVDFESGYVRDQLNSDAVFSPWLQLIGTDPCPILSGDRDYICLEHHYDDDNICTKCGANKPFEMKDGYYLIYTAGELKKFAALVNNNQTLNAKLMNDIVLNTNVIDAQGNLQGSNFTQWTPMCSSSPYTGIFDGQGFSISGLYINTTYSNQGLFASVGKATLTGVNIKDSYVKGNGYVGALCANASGTTITKCSNQGVVVTTGDYIGGLCGNISSSTKISYCYNTGVIVDKTSSSSPNAYLGGIAGYNSSSTISNCFNYNYKSYSTYSNPFAYSNTNNGTNFYLNSSETTDGGRTKEQFGNGEVCYSLNGGVEDESAIFRQNFDDEYPSFTGLIVKESRFHCTDHQFDVNGICSICGVVRPFEIVDGYCMISNKAELYSFAKLVNEGSVNLKAKLANNITVNDDVVDAEGVLNTGSYKEWTPIGLAGKEFAGEFDGQGYTVSGLYVNSSTQNYVGLFGYVKKATIKNVQVANSYFRANKYVGGIVGEAEYSKIAVCANKNTTVVCVGQNAGGIVGYSYSNTSIDNCYNTGRVSGKYVGGITYSYSGINVSNSFNYGALSGDYHPISFNATIGNCFYLADEGDYRSKTAEQFKSGLVCWLLNHRESNDSVVWRQNDDMPYPSFEGNVKDYTPCSEHQYDENDICSVCHMQWMPDMVDGFYQIATVKDLYWFADIVKKYDQTINGLVVADIKVNNDVVNKVRNGEESGLRDWTPIGVSGIHFRGVFDGGNHTISGLYLNNTLTNQGLIGVGKECTIRNVNVEDTYFSVGSQSGGVCGQLFSDDNPSTIENCTFRGVLNVAYDGAGICGSTQKAHIRNCSNYADVTGTGSNVAGVLGYCYTVIAVDGCSNYGQISGSYKVAGVVGSFSDEAFSTTYEGVITNCYNEGTVKASDTYLGGICGYFDAKEVSKCINKGNIISQVSSSSSSQCGGIIGYMSTAQTLSECSNYGNITGYGNYVGGVVGNNYQRLIEFVKLYNYGSVTGYSSGTAGLFGNTSSQITLKYCGNHGAVKGNSNVGGVVGYIYDSTLDSVSSTNKVEGVVNVGGLLGYSSSCNLNNCLRKDSTIVTGSYAGGITGETYSTNFVNCRNEGVVVGCGAGVAGICPSGASKLEDCVNTGNVVANGSGYAVSGITNKLASSAVIKNCKNEGDIDGRYTGGAMQVAGIVFDANQNAVSDCENTGAVYGAQYCAAGICAINASSIANCVNRGLIKAEGSVSGIAGIYIQNQKGTTSKITNCHNEGVIDGRWANGEVSAAGIALLFGGGTAIEDCSNKGDVFGGQSGVAGIALSTSTVTNCSNSGNIKSVGASSYTVGILGSGGVVTSCRNEGTIDGRWTSDIASAAGIAGSCGQVVDCSNTGSVYGSGSYAAGICGSSSTVSGSYNSGDIYGYNATPTAGISANSVYMIEKSYNAGNVTSDSSAVGGILGVAENVVLFDCYNTGVVKSLQPNYSGATYGGGICGSLVSTFTKESYDTESGSYVYTIEPCSQTLNDCYSYAECVNMIAPDSSTVTLNNCYYLANEETTDGGRTAEQFANGVVAVALNGDRTGDDIVWFQQENYPAFEGDIPVVKLTLNLNDAVSSVNWSSTETYTKVTYVRENITSNWGSLCLPFAFSASDCSNSGSTVTLFTCSFNDGSIVLTQVTSVSAGQPVLFYMAKPSTLTVEADEVGLVSSPASSGSLVGTFSSLNVGVDEGTSAENSYYLKNNMYYKGKENFVVKPFHAYITSASALKSFRLVLPDEVDENEELIIVDKQISAIYNMVGQRVAQMRDKGVYLIQYSDGSTQKVVISE